MKEQTFMIKLRNRKKIKHTNKILKREKIKENYFLEYGEHKDQDYTYVSLLSGDIDYYGQNPRINKEHYFSYKKNGIWRVLSSDLTSLVKDFKNKREALNKLKELSRSLP